MDGTGNSSAKLFKTNVWRFYKAVDLADPIEKAEPRQFAYYHDGVGTSSFKPLTILGGAFGVGLAKSVRDSYAFVCRTYREGDRIYVFGFSRGAFAARLLAGLILDQGIVPYAGSEADLKRWSAAAYRTFRGQRFFRYLQLHVFAIRWLRNRLIDTYERWSLRRAYLHYSKIEKIKHVGNERLTVEFVGVWDTVSAYGLPVDELTRAVDIMVWPLSMPDHDLSPDVKRAVHVLALDDERNTFHPQFWNEGPPSDPKTGPAPVWLKKWVAGFLNRPELLEKPTGSKPNPDGYVARIEEERLSQVWFAGVHADVGGGYPDEGLSHVSLEWMMTEAKRKKVRFCKEIWDQYRALSDENGPLHDSRQGLGGYYRYNPRRIERLTRKSDVQKDVHIERTKIHESVFGRIKIGQDGYAPIALPNDFDVVLLDGTIKPGIDFLGAGTPLGDESAYAKSREHVYNWVWWRRIAYFFTLIATLRLAAMPLFDPALQRGACDSRWCFVSEWVTAIGLVLPGFAATWTDSFASHPGIFVLLATLIALGLVAGGVFERRIRDEMRRVWYTIEGTTPEKPKQSFTPPDPPGAVNRFVECLRTRRSYRRALRSFTHQILPAIFFGFVVYAAFAVLMRVSFSIQDSLGAVCNGEAQALDPNAAPVTVPFRTDALCQATGVELKKGGTYRLTFTIPEGKAWFDGTIPVGPNGVLPNCVTGRTALGMSLAVPLRRRLTQPWFKPMARINTIGTDDYPLDPAPSIPEEWTTSGTMSTSSNQDTCSKTGHSGEVRFSSEIVARSSGKLFLYVNDAVLAPFGKKTFYRNNHGSADVLVELVKDAPKQDTAAGKDSLPVSPDPAR